MNEVKRYAPRTVVMLLEKRRMIQHLRTAPLRPESFLCGSRVDAEPAAREQAVNEIPMSDDYERARHSVTKLHALSQTKYRRKVMAPEVLESVFAALRIISRVWT
ncbi:MAG: hypothetical protein ACLUHG_02395 [Sutterella wadsworthensis]